MVWFVEIWKRRIFSNDSIIKNNYSNFRNAINNANNESKQESLRKIKVGFTKMLKAIVKNAVKILD